MGRWRAGSQGKLKSLGGHKEDRERLEGENSSLNTMDAKEKKDAHKRGLKELKKPWR